MRAASAGKEGDVAELKRQLDDLTKRIDNLSKG